MRASTAADRLGSRALCARRADREQESAELKSKNGAGRLLRLKGLAPDFPGFIAMAGSTMVECWMASGTSLISGNRRERVDPKIMTRFKISRLAPTEPMGAPVFPDRYAL